MVRVSVTLPTFRFGLRWRPAVHKSQTVARRRQGAAATGKWAENANRWSTTPQGVFSSASRGPPPQPEPEGRKVTAHPHHRHLGAVRDVKLDKFSGTDLGDCIRSRAKGLGVPRARRAARPRGAAHPRVTGGRLKLALAPPAVFSFKRRHVPRPRHRHRGRHPQVRGARGPAAEGGCSRSTTTAKTSAHPRWRSTRWRRGRRRWSTWWAAARRRSRSTPGSCRWTRRSSGSSIR